MLAGVSDYMNQNYKKSYYQEDQSLTLFVGCLDPSTTKEDLVSYFKSYDPWIKAKLIINFKTGHSKQCGLLFCSSAETVESILQSDHYVLNRRVLVNFAQKEYKGTKSSNLYQVQLSGLEPDTIIQLITNEFLHYQGFVKARLVQGLHAKQKKVAVLYFQDQDSAQELLKRNHIKVGKRNCKIAPYQKSTNSSPFVLSVNSKKDLQLKDKLFNSSSTQKNEEHQLYKSSQANAWGTPKTQTSESSTNKYRNISPLKITSIDTFKMCHQCMDNKSYGKARTQDFVHPVEAEKDYLYKIFCMPSLSNFPTKNNSLLKLSTESKDTRED